MSINLDKVKEKLNLEDVDMVSPVKILEKASCEIEEITGGLVKGVISVYDGPIRSYKMTSAITAAIVRMAAAEQNYDIQDDLGEIGYEDEKYDFCFIAPSLPNYKYRLMFMSFGIGGYPVELVLQEEVGEEIYNGSKYIFTADDRKELEALLERIFSSQKVIHVVQELVRAAKIAQEKRINASAVSSSKPAAELEDAEN